MIYLALSTVRLGLSLKDRSKTSFIGSVNETYAAWKLNYEILWEDDSQEAVDQGRKNLITFGTALMQFPFRLCH